MLKRGFGKVSLLLVLISILIFGISGVIAADADGDGIDDETGESVVDVESDDVGDSDDEGDDFDDEFDEEGFDDEFDDEDAGEDDLDELIEEAGGFDEELESDGGLTPDSALYFVDEIFDNFASDADVREEKIAEMRALAEKCGGGDESACENVRAAFERYKEHADEFEREVTPEERERARRSSRAIRGVLVREIAKNVAPGEKDEFVREIVKKEKGIETAAEIAGKIKELCEQLSKLDPVEYSRVCSAGDDAPRWQRDLDEDLTDEQKKEVEVFFEIMTECMSTSGRECRCDDISVSAFAEQCSIVAPLAVKCEEGDEDACDDMDVATEGMEDLLPEHLQDVMRRLEGRFEDEQFDKFAPRECVEAGARTKEECFKIMFKIHAPPECAEAFESGEISVNNEREAREACEEIMFKENAPEECIEAGLKNPRECGALMFRENAPEECVEAGLTGENRGDEKECRRIMENLRGEFEGEGRGRGGPGGFGGGNCRGIQDAQERLKCYDGAIQGSGEHFEGRRGFDERFRETKQKERQCAESCFAQGGAWDFSNGQCSCRVGEGREDFRREEFRDYNENPPYDCARLDCLNGQVCSPYRGCISPEERERELEENSGYNPPPSYGEEGYVDNTAKYDCSKLNCGPSPNYCDPWQGCLSGGDGFNPDGSSCNEGYEWDGSKCIPFGTGDYNFGNSGSVEPSPAPTEPPPSEPAPTTGSVITGNAFLDYYFR